MPFRMVRWLWFGRPVRGLSGGSNGSKRRHCASVKSLRLTRATWALRAGLVPLCRHAVAKEQEMPNPELEEARELLIGTWVGIALLADTLIEHGMISKEELLLN